MKKKEKKISAVVQRTRDMSWQHSRELSEGEHQTVNACRHVEEMRTVCIYKKRNIKGSFWLHCVGRMGLTGWV